MIRGKLLLILILLPAFLFSQELKKVTKKVKHSERREVYYVLKSDKSIRQGNYQKLYGNTIRINGFYKKGEKDSIWEFYDSDGKLEQKYDYTRKVLMFDQNKYDNKTKYEVIAGTDTNETILDSPPIYIGTDIALDVLVDSIEYPQEAIENQITGTVIISFVVHENGKVSDYRIKEGVGHGLNEEALRVVKIIPNNWVPGVLNGKPVDVEMVRSIKFLLN